MQRLIKASCERLAVVRRAEAFVAVADGNAFPEAACQAGLKSGDSVSTLVTRFKEQGLAALSVAVGRGRTCTDTSQERRLIAQDVQRLPDREEDSTATWSWKTLERALRKKGLPQRGASTIREVWHASGDRWQQSRTGVRTGDARQVRTSGTVMTSDLETLENTDGSSTPTSRRKRRGWLRGTKRKRSPLRPSRSLELLGNPKGIPHANRRRTSGEAPPRS